MSDGQLRFLLGLTEGFGHALWQLPKLYDHYQSFEKIWDLPEESLRYWGIKANVLRCLRAYKQEDQLNTNIERYRDRLITLVPFWSSLYPKSLINCQSRPLLLFCLGDPQVLCTHAITVIGSRKFQADKTTLLDKFFDALKDYKPTIISGLARGIDGVAHRLALQKGLPTIAVVAHGLDYIYPPEHKPMRDQIISMGGAIVSELPLGVRPEKYLFLARNRIMVGMSQNIVVVEAGLQSGTLASATMAADMGREVWVIPGSVGCDLLLDEGANCLTPFEDLLDNLGRLRQDE